MGRLDQMNILIVESKAKCKTLEKYLGRGEWRVLATGGHVERLPVDRELHPKKEVKKAYWSNEKGELPRPPWYWTERGEAAITAIKEEAGRHDAVQFYLAADPDREGERIAWHLEKLLRDLGPCYRVRFNAITKEKVLSAVESVGEPDRDLIDAALIRIFMDRAIGWRAKNIAKRFTTTSSNSMGRVQTPALGIIVDRELEREAHKPVRYFEVHARTQVTDWSVQFHERSDPKAWVDDKGRFQSRRTADEGLAGSAFSAISSAGKVEVTDAHRKSHASRPKPPFDTESLFSAAGSRMGWSPKKTSALAGKLYEAGHLTYPRTDSTRLDKELVDAAQVVIASSWGSDQLGSSTQAQASGTVQDAHEAIRPTRIEVDDLPDQEPDVRRLYALVRARTLASLMRDSSRISLSLEGRCEGLGLTLKGAVSWYEEPGWRHAFAAENVGDELETEPVDVEVRTTLELQGGAPDGPNPELREDETKPPARYKSHTLVKAMKAAGIGRPSTYAKVVETLEERRYVTNSEGALAPTESGRNIWLLAAPLFALSDGRDVFDTEYTAEMEDALTEVAEGKISACYVWETMRDEFMSSHESARVASQSGALTPRTRRSLEEYLRVMPEEAVQIGDLDKLYQPVGVKLLKKLRETGTALPPTAKQNEFIESLLTGTGLTLPEAIEAAGMTVEEGQLTKDQASELIEYLKTLPQEGGAPSPRQLGLIKRLAGKLGLDEGEACALSGAESYSTLTGGRGGTASELIEILMARQ